MLYVECSVANSISLNDGLVCLLLRVLLLITLTGLQFRGDRTHEYVANCSNSITVLSASLLVQMIFSPPQIIWEERVTWPNGFDKHADELEDIM